MKLSHSPIANRYLLSVAIAAALTFFPMIVNADAPVGGASDASCSFGDVPRLDERNFGVTDSSDEQYATLRNLRTRVADLLPDQQARVDEARALVDGLRASLKSSDDSTALSAQLETLKGFLQKADSDIAIRAKFDTKVPSPIIDFVGAGLPTTSAELEKRRTGILNEISKVDTALTENAAVLAGLPTRIQEATTAYQRERECNYYLKNLAQAVEAKTIGVLIPSSQSGQFKLWLSVIYAGIVLVLIGGFYGLAYKDRTAAAAILMQQSGIQFITLFSLVIAIILFGVLGILADKELAALLGGISGYILGRVGDRHTPTTNDGGSAGAADANKAVG